MFDVNDFDETLPGPFEYDVKRMAASFTIAARNNGFSKADARAATMASVAAYREAMAGFAQMGTMEVWYAHLDEDDILASVRGAVGAAEHHDKAARAPRQEGREGQDEREGQGRQARTRAAAGGQGRREDVATRRTRATACRRCRSSPSWWTASTGSSTSRRSWCPCGSSQATYGISADETDQIIRDQFRAYRATLQDDRRRLLERFEVVDVARKVVGVGSVGTRAFIVLLQGRDAHDPLFLQVKEATASVLEQYLPKSRYAEAGERVVQGQRMMQAASDIFLGWTQGVDADRHYYWRQLRDMKGSAVVEAMIPTGLTFYARLCGWTLARAHARSGDPVAIAQYLGDGDTFDRSITDFSARYADQNEQDFQEFVKAVRSGDCKPWRGCDPRGRSSAEWRPDRPVTGKTDRGLPRRFGFRAGRRSGRGTTTNSEHQQVAHHLKPCDDHPCQLADRGDVAGTRPWRTP